MTATASDTSLPWDSERDWDDCYIDKYLKCRKRSNEKRAVFLQEKFDECTTDEGKILLRIEINEAVSKSASFCQEYFDRTGIHLPPMYKGELMTVKMKKAMRAENAAKRARDDALIDKISRDMSLAVV